MLTNYIHIFYVNHLGLFMYKIYIHAMTLISNDIIVIIFGCCFYVLIYYASCFNLSVIIFIVLFLFSAYFRNNDFCEPSQTVLLSAVRTILTVIGQVCSPCAFTSASLNTDLIQLIAVSRSCPPPSQLNLLVYKKQKNVSKIL